MKTKTKFRLVSLVMFLAAVIFVCCALACPTCGRTIYIGDFAFGAEQWRVCYLAYAVVTVSVFLASFFVKNKSERK